MPFEERNSITAEAVATQSTQHQNSSGIISKWTFGIDFPDRPLFTDVRETVFEPQDGEPDEDYYTDTYPLFAPLRRLNETYHKSNLTIFPIGTEDYTSSMLDVEIATEHDEDGDERVKWFRVYVRDDADKTDPNAVEYLCNRLADDYTVTFRFPIDEAEPSSDTA